MKRRIVGEFSFVAVAGLVTFTGAGFGIADDASIVVAQADAPSLAPPANFETLPPPEKPADSQFRQRHADQSIKVPSQKQPFLRPAEPKNPQPRTEAEYALDVQEEPMPAPIAPTFEELYTEHRYPDVEVRPAPPIKYDTDRDARRMYRASGEINVVMVAKNPADGCYYQIPMCIPACCIGEPSVVGGQGIFGRGVVEFCWDCGFRAKVKFRHILGDVRVDYEGD